MKETFHYHHHRVEALQARRRFAGINGALFVVAAVIIGSHYAASHAAGTPPRVTPTPATQIDGAKIDTSGVGTYGGSIAGPYASATVHKVSKSASTTANPWSFDLNPESGGSDYSFTISPTTAGNYVLKGYTYEVGNVAGWNPQATNFHAGSTFNITIHPGQQVHMRWIYKFVPPPTVKPTPPPVTPAPTPAPPAKTPTPAPHKTPTPGAGGGSGGTPAAADTTAPSAPANFQAQAATDNAVIALSWEAATDNVGVTSYHIERSIDQTTWTTVADQSDLTYSDDTTAFGIHYYYRVSAFDDAGNQSTFATADATTPAFSGNTTTGSGQTFSSDDNVASVTVPPGAFDDDTDCTVEAGDVTVNAGSKKLVGGPYQLVCKDADGNTLDTAKSALSWKYTFATKLKGYTKPVAVMIADDGTQSAASAVSFNAKTGVLAFTTASPTTTAVLASVKPGFPWTFVVFTLLVLGIVAAIVVVILRQKQKQSYDEYLKKKYYNL